MTSIQNIDLISTNFLNSIFPHSIFFDYFFSFFSLVGNSIFVWLIVIVAILIFEERKNPGISRRDILFVSIFLITFITASLTSQIFLKNLIKRPRPCYSKAYRMTDPVIGRPMNCSKDYSFPSTHATTAFASAGIVVYFDKKRKWLYYLLAAIIGFSRIYLGFHFFLDIIAGALIGWIINQVILRFSQKLIPNS